MAQVFLSYDRDDGDRARPIALALERAGHSVWWDLHVRGGAQFSKVIEEALNQAEAVVVLWSSAAVESAWVRDEAAAGRDSGRLVPVLLDPVQSPLGFRQYQNIDMSSWSGRGKPPRLADVLQAIESVGGRPATVPAQPVAARPQRSRGQLVRWSLIAATVMTGLVVLSLSIRSGGASIPTVMVTPADQSPDARSLARDLLVQLGNMQAQRADSIQLVGESSSGKPDLILEISGVATGPRPAANLVLLRGKDRQILSSQELAATGSKAEALKQSLAMAAARNIGCATEAMRPRQGQLDLSTLKTYVSACNRFSMLYGSDDIAILVPQLEQVIQREPKFEPAWKELLLARASLQAIPSDHPKPPRQALINQITAARRIDRDLPEAKIAEIELLPPTDFAGRIDLADKLANLAPENPFVLASRARQLMLVGRMTDAVHDTERAAMLDPLSAYSRNAYIQALAYSGRIPKAFQEIERAAPLALGAKNLIETDFFLSMRHGDPHHALRLLRSYGTSKSHEAFLLARIEPTPANVERSIGIARLTAFEFALFGSYAEVLAAFGRNDDLYRMLMEIPPSRMEGGIITALYKPIFKDLRQDPRFLQVAKRFGLLGYWRTSGKWPDFCGEPDLPYDCKAEAAKVAAT